jgi:hypothetical protein
MSVKRIAIVAVAVIVLLGFIGYGVHDAVKTKDKLDFQEVQLKSKTTEIKDLNVKYERLNLELDKAAEDKNTNQEQLDKLNKEKEALEKQKSDLEAQLQAKIEQKNKIALAASKANSIGTATAYASSGSCDDYMTQAGITSPIARDLVGRENKACDPCRYNDGSPTGKHDCEYSGDRAYGIPQSLPGNKMASEGADWKTNPVTQLRWMQKYVLGRYGSWEGAKAHHDQMGWY